MVSESYQRELTWLFILPPATSCLHPVENRLKFIIDASSSVKAKNFIHSQNFAKNISNTFDLRHGDVRVGVLTYSSTVHDHQDIELGDPIDGADDLNARIDAMPYEHGDTHTGAALR